MIYGIGVDIVRVDRMKAAIERWGSRFLSRVFTENEISFCCRKKEPYRSLAVRFAAKEALIKAMAAEVPVSLKDIEVSTSPTGKPSLHVRGSLASFFLRKSIGTTHLTLSHEQDYGIACVVLEVQK